MKIKLFTDSLGAGGAQRQLVGLAVMLKQKGYDVSVVLYHEIPFFAKFLSNNGVPYSVLSGGANWISRIWVFYKYFKHERLDWVISYQETPSIIATICRVLGCKFQLIVSERNVTQFIGFKEYARFYLYRWVDSIVPNSHTQCNFITKHYPRLKDKMTTITNFVDLKYFSPLNHFRRNVPEILVVASIVSSKNTLGFIEAVKLLTLKGVKFHVSWYGKTSAYADYLNDCLFLINKYKIGEYIQLLDKVENINLKYKEADYFCLPSFYEGTPNVICEAIASGLPVMCSAVCDNGYYVKDGVNGVLFDPQNPHDMAHKIEQLLQQSESEYQNYCKSSREIAEDMLSEEAFVQKYIEILLK